MIEGLAQHISPELYQLATPDLAQLSTQPDMQQELLLCLVVSTSLNRLANLALVAQDIKSTNVTEHFKLAEKITFQELTQIKSEFTVIEHELSKAHFAKSSPAVSDFMISLRGLTLSLSNIVVSGDFTSAFCIDVENVLLALRGCQNCLVSYEKFRGLRVKRDEMLSCDAGKKMLGLLNLQVAELQHPRDVERLQKAVEALRIEYHLLPEDTLIQKSNALKSEMQYLVAQLAALEKPDDASKKAQVAFAKMEYRLCQASLHRETVVETWKPVAEAELVLLQTQLDLMRSKGPLTDLALETNVCYAKLVVALRQAEVELQLCQNKLDSTPEYVSQIGTHRQGVNPKQSRNYLEAVHLLNTAKEVLKATKARFVQAGFDLPASMQEAVGTDSSRSQVLDRSSPLIGVSSREKTEDGGPQALSEIGAASPAGK